MLCALQGATDMRCLQPRDMTREEANEFFTKIIKEEEAAVAAKFALLGQVSSHMCPA